MAKILTVSHQSHQFMEILKKKKKWQGLLLRFALTFSACKQNIRNWGKSKEGIPETTNQPSELNRKKTKQNKTKTKENKLKCYRSRLFLFSYLNFSWSLRVMKTKRLDWYRNTAVSVFLLLIVNHDSRHRTWIISRVKISSHALFERWEFSKK